MMRHPSGRFVRAIHLICGITFTSDWAHGRGFEQALTYDWCKRSYMAVSGWQLNRFEKILLRAALVLAGLLVAIRIGAVVILSLLHHSH